MPTPKISIVMGVYNNVQTINQCLEHIRDQSFGDYELLIFDDASTDESAAIIQEFADKDDRIKFTINTHNKGLTQILIEGCELAQGEYIARQDADDYSASRRLELQNNVLDKYQDVALVASSSQLLGPSDEVLIPLVENNEEEMNDIWRRAHKKGINPHHGSTLFRKSDYDLAGGYRSPFKVAQDCDLWWRLMEHGRFVSIDETLYFSRFHIKSITAKARELQSELSRYALALTQLRRKGLSEDELLHEINDLTSKSYSGVDLDEGVAESYYFVAACLNRNNDGAALRYAKAALLAKPYKPAYYYQFGRALLNRFMG